MERWTIKSLEEMDNLQFAVCILNERRNKLSNIYSPLAIKLEKAAHEINAILDQQIKQVGNQSL
jgi:hypothetical protein